MIKKFIKKCKNCKYEEFIVNKDVFVKEKCNICDSECDIINVNSIEEVYEGLVNEMGVEGLCEFIKEREKENYDLVVYMRNKGLKV